MSIAFDLSLFITAELSEEDTFSQYDAPNVILKYVCGVCWGELQIVYIPNEARVMIVCPEHGSVCHAGRVTRNTVSINYEVAANRFHQVIRNVDEWKCLLPPERERKSIKSMLGDLGF